MLYLRVTCAALLMAALIFAAVPWLNLIVNPATVLAAVIVMPVVEETTRALSAYACHVWKVPLRAAMLFGLVYGVFEMALKLSDQQAHIGPDVRTILNILGVAGSIPIHVALSVAFYSLQRARLPRMIALHGLLNLTLIVVLTPLWERVSIPVYAAISLAVVTALSVLLALWARRRQDHVRLDLW